MYHPTPQRLRMHYFAQGQQFNVKMHPTNPHAGLDTLPAALEDRFASFSNESR
jgi:hypothetical protein